MCPIDTKLQSNLFGTHVNLCQPIPMSKGMGINESTPGLPCRTLDFKLDATG
jgi:hypothetical protein